MEAISFINCCEGGGELISYFLLLYVEQYEVNYGYLDGRRNPRCESPCV